MFVCVAEQTSADTVIRHIDEPLTVEIDNLTTLRFTIVRRPRVRCVQLGPLAEQLRTAGNQLFGSLVELGVIHVCSVAPFVVGFFDRHTV